GFSAAQLALAEERVGDFSVFLTGGDALLVRQRVPMARVVPDLVFIGLAAACPLP
ncbi:MAG: pantothenate kinase, partial [Anaerolineales bacterium]